MSPQPPSTTADPLPLNGRHWDWVLALYAKPGVADACLELQDGLGVDVIVLMFAIFAADQHGISGVDADIAQADAVVSAWREQVITPLRDLRTRMKAAPVPLSAEAADAAEAVRLQIKAAELAAEQVSMAMLSRHFRGRPQGDLQSTNPSRLVQRVAVFYAERNHAPPPPRWPAGVMRAVRTLQQAVRP